MMNVEFEAWHIANVNDPLGYWESLNGDPFKYSRDHLGVPVMADGKALVTVSKNVDLGYAIEYLMRGLRAKKIKPKYIEVLPVDYAVLDYEDVLQSTPYVMATL